jgi:hypothetical protein
VPNQIAFVMFECKTRVVMMLLVSPDVLSKMILDEGCDYFLPVLVRSLHSVADHWQSLELCQR